MSSIRCIVAATDFSTFSERAVQRAAHIARQHDAELHLLHVLGSEVEQRLRRAKFVDVDITDWLTRHCAQADNRLETLLSGIEKGVGNEQEQHPASDGFWLDLAQQSGGVRWNPFGSSTIHPVFR